MDNPSPCQIRASVRLFLTLLLAAVLLAAPAEARAAGVLYTAGEGYTLDESGPTVTITRSGATPTNLGAVTFNVTFSEAVTGVEASDFSLLAIGLSGASITGVSGGPEVYSVAVATGSGNGFVRLDVPDTATIVDLLGNPLGDLPYTSGQDYDIDKTGPYITIWRSVDAAMNSDQVTFDVAFTEAVTGMDVSDFSLVSEGEISGASIVSVGDGWTGHSVTVATGSGSGTLRLDVPATATITDLAGNPLQNLPYTTGEVYTIDKTAPTVVWILRSSDTPTHLHEVTFRVAFSEPVTGVDAATFGVVTGSGLSGASIVEVSGGTIVYTVIVDAGEGGGDLWLEIDDQATVFDGVGYPLDDLPFVGPAYTLLQPVYLPVMVR